MATMNGVPPQPWSHWPHAFAQTAKNVTIHYVDVGPRDAMPVVLMHGWPDMWFGWRNQIGPLSKHYRVIVPDMRGFGQSSAPYEMEEYGTKKVTNDFAELLNILKIQKAVFIGHDWGGAMAWRMCLYHPERVIAVCGVCTAYTPPAQQYIPLDVVVTKLPQFFYQQFLADLDNTGKLFDSAPHRFFTAMYRPAIESALSDNTERLSLIQMLQNVADSPHPVFTTRSSILSQPELEYYVQQYANNGFRSTLQYYASRKLDFETECAFKPEINHRALFIAAAKDSVLRPSMARNMPKLLPNLEMKLIEDAGHWVLWEKPAEVNAMLLEWLAKIQQQDESETTRAKL